jgi:protein-S-isoprenylcysteine O-methyltransferase Ste14
MSHPEPIDRRHRAALLTVAMGSTFATLALTALGWGSASGLMAHPARAAFVVLMLVATVVALASPVNLSSGEREDIASRWIFLPAAAGIALLAWLMPFLDRHDLWTLDGDTVRWLGVAILLAGSVLRIWPMFVLGRRFSGLVAIQSGHALMTEGPYRHIRHPSYLGMMLGLLGWALVFRSSVGLVGAGLGMPLLAARIEAEEALLASRFGDAYTEYRRRTWRLIPGVY